MTQDLEALANMEYPGRFIIAGRDPEGTRLIVCYGVTGRSSSSKARKLEHGEKTNTIRTEVTDPEQLAKGSAALLLYPAMVAHEGAVVASNGAQTKLVYSKIKERVTYDHAQEMLRREENQSSHSFLLSGLTNVIKDAFKKQFLEYDAREDRWIDITSYEPDEPNNTPRISLLAFGDTACFHIVKNDGNEKEVEYYGFKFQRGEGKLLATYAGENKNPLPSFQGEPRSVRTPWSTPQEAVEAVYETLRPETRVCVASMMVNGQTVSTARRDRHQEER